LDRRQQDLPVLELPIASGKNYADWTISIPEEPMLTIFSDLTKRLDSGLAIFEKNKRRLQIILLCAIGVIGIALYLWGTAPHGIGILTDSVDYIWSGQNLAKGIGLGTLNGQDQFVPMTVEPPLYPMLLASFNLLGISSLAAARWLGAFLLGLILVLFGMLLIRLTDRSFWIPLIGVLILFFTAATWITNLYAMTEPIYIALTLLGLLFVDNYFLLGKRRWLIAASILLGFAFLARYIGAATIAVAILVLLFQERWELKSKVLDSLILAGISVFPILVWMIRNILLARTTTSYAVRFIPISDQEWVLFFQTVQSWILPVEQFKFTLIKLLVFLLGVVFAFLFLKGRNIPTRSKTQLPLLLALYTFFFILFLIASRWIAYPLVTFYQDRMLFPALASLFCLILFGVYLLQRAVWKRSVLFSAIMAGILMTLAWSYFLNGNERYPAGLKLLVTSRINGIGLQFRTYELNGYQTTMAQFPKDDVVFSDDTQRTYFFTARPSSDISDMTPSDIALINEQRQEKGVIVTFFHDSPALTLEMQQQLPFLKLVYHDDSGRAIYFGDKDP
jgi:4-amino-4-deoxy-L-arabinose transferase-like glycosyltransferase